MNNQSTSLFSGNKVLLVLIMACSLAVFLTERGNRALNAITNANSISSAYFRFRNPLDRNETVKINIDPEDETKLLEYAHFSPPKKKWLKGVISMNGKEYEVKLKLSGSDPIHYKDNRFSYSVKFKDAIPSLGHARRFKLISGIAYNDHLYAADRMASEIGLIARFGIPKMAFINDVSHGHYYMIEDVSKQLLERQFGLTNYSTIEDTDFLGEQVELNTMLNSDSGYVWSDLIELDEKDGRFSVALEQFENVWDLVSQNEIQKAQNSFDKPYLVKYLALAESYSTKYCQPFGEVELLYDYTRAKFFPVFKGRIRQTEYITEQATDKYFTLNGWLLHLLSQSSELRREIDAYKLEYKPAIDSSLAPENAAYSTSQIAKLSKLESPTFHTGNAVFEDNLQLKMKKKTKVDSAPTTSRLDLAMETLRRNGFRFSVNDSQIVIAPESYFIQSSLLLDVPLELVFQPGSRLKLGPTVTCIIKGDVLMKGSKEQPIIIQAADSTRPFGCFALISNSLNSSVSLDFLDVSGGSESNYGGYSFTGQFAVYGSNVRVKNSVFTNSMGDDGFNMKYGKAEIEHCIFSNNLADQVDLDFCFVTIRDCTFSPSKIDKNGDGLDLSGSYAKVENCNISGFLDKGLSLGEKSRVIVTKNRLDNNYNAVAVKDQTVAYCLANNFNSNHRDIITYIKKSIFAPPLVYTQTPPPALRLAIVDGKQSSMGSTDIQKEKERFDTLFHNYSASMNLESQQELTNILAN